jgi:hypothetical protein
LIVWVFVCTVVLSACGSGSKTSSPKAPTGSIASTTTTEANQIGPFAVGRRTVTFVDSTRRTPANGRTPSKPTRTLETIIEYPTQGTADAGHERTDAAPLAGTYPMVLYLHGFGAHADDPYLHPLAAAGFVTVAATEPLTNADAPGGPNRVDVPNIPGDVRFLISQMLHLRARQADLERIIDPNEIGLIGGSLGAAIAYEVGYASGSRDNRIKAVIEQSCGCPPHSYPADAEPLMLMHGTADTAAPYQWTAADFAGARSPKYLVTLVGAKHIQYAEPWLSISIRAAIDLFVGFLKHDDSALARLLADATVSDQSRLQKG